MSSDRDKYDPSPKRSLPKQQDMAGAESGSVLMQSAKKMNAKSLHSHCIAC